MSSLTIRAVAETDFRACAGIISQAFNTDSDEYGFEPSVDLAPITARLGEYLSGGAKLFGAYLEDTQVGFFLLDSKDEEIYEVGKLSILPAFQGRGYGQNLLDEAIRIIAELGGVSAVCVIIKENDRLKSWLEKNRFIEEFSGPLTTRASICLMQRDIASGA